MSNPITMELLDAANAVVEKAEFANAEGWKLGLRLSKALDAFEASTHELSPRLEGKDMRAP